MRILHVAWEYPPRLHGGIGRHLGGLCPALAARGAAVTVVANPHREAAPVTTADGVRVLRPPTATPPPDEAGWAAQVLHANLGLQAVALDAVARGVDLVHAHDWLVGFAARSAAAAGGVPLVVTVHATERGRHQGWLPGPLNRWIDGEERALAGAAAAVVVCSDAMRREAVAVLGLDPDGFTVIPNAAAAEDYRRPAAGAVARARRAAGDPAHLLVFAGRLEYEKGVHVLLDALRRLRRRRRGVRLVIAGTGTDAPRLAGLADEFGLARAVDFVGFQSRRALRAWYAAADVVVVPSLYEPYGLVAAEAAAAGAPLVASSVGGLVELFGDGDRAVLVPPADPGRLASAVAQVLDDPAGARARARRARRAVRTWSWDDAAGALHRRYGALIGS